MLTTLEQILLELGITEYYLKKNKLPPCLEPPLQELEVVTIDFEGKPFILQKRAAQAFREMQIAAFDDKITIKPYSGFRSYLYQKNLIQKHLQKGRPLENILSHIAIPGFSEHHTGRAVDIYADDHSTLEEAFEQTLAYQWLTKNASQFNFKLSYPRDNQTGIIFEPWHWCFHP